jgi:hypothetical protein
VRAAAEGRGRRGLPSGRAVNAERSEAGESSCDPGQGGEGAVRGRGVAPGGPSELRLAAGRGEGPRSWLREVVHSSPMAEGGGDVVATATICARWRGPGTWTLFTPVTCACLQPTPCPPAQHRASIIPCWQAASWDPRRKSAPWPSSPPQPHPPFLPPAPGPRQRA